MMSIKNLYTLLSKDSMQRLRNLKFNSNRVFKWALLGGAFSLMIAAILANIASVKLQHCDTAFSNYTFQCEPTEYLGNTNGPFLFNTFHVYTKPVGCNLRNLETNQTYYTTYPLLWNIYHYDQGSNDTTILSLPKDMKCEKANLFIRFFMIVLAGPFVMVSSYF